MIRLWASPQGALKAALAGTSDPPQMAPRPQRVPADVMTVGKTSVAWEGNKPVLTFPIPGVPTATATATLDAKFMAERVVVKNGANTYEFTYSDYKDWNNPLNPAEAFYAGKMTEKKNGTVVRDITTTVTETGQMYVVMPVPASVKAAIRPTHQPPNWTLASNRSARDADGSRRTPRRADGKPDMTGNWGRALIQSRVVATADVVQRRKNCKIGEDNFGWIMSGSRPRGLGPGRPVYKPEFWDKIQELDQWTNKYDPVMTCQPLGLPRHGTPRRIIQTDNDVIFFYRANADYGGGNTNTGTSPRTARAERADGEPGYVLWVQHRKMGRRYARHRLHSFRRYDVVGTRRPVPFRQHAYRRETHACRQ